MLTLVYWDRLTSGADLRTLSLAVLLLPAAVAYQFYRRTQDIFNPLTVLMALCAIRIGLPALTLEATGMPVGTFLNSFNIDEATLVRGQNLAGLSVLGVL